MNPELSYWLTLTEFARVMGRPERTVRQWAQNGTLVEFGLPVWCISTGRFHNRHFVLTPSSLIDQ
jgi:hypothetical protein